MHLGSDSPESDVVTGRMGALLKEAIYSVTWVGETRDLTVEQIMAESGVLYLNVRS